MSTAAITAGATVAIMGGATVTLTYTGRRGRAIVRRYRADQITLI